MLWFFFFSRHNTANLLVQSCKHTFLSTYKSSLHKLVNKWKLPWKKKLNKIKLSFSGYENSQYLLHEIFKGCKFHRCCNQGPTKITFRHNHTLVTSLIAGPVPKGILVWAVRVFLIPRSHSVRQYTHNQILTTLKIR